MTDGPQIWMTETGLCISQDHPTRASQALPLGGYALYEKQDPDDKTGIRIGLAEFEEAVKWLSGEPLERIKYMKVDELDHGDECRLHPKER